MRTTCPCCNGHVRNGICENCGPIEPDEPDEAHTRVRARKEKRGPIRPRPRPPKINSK